MNRPLPRVVYIPRAADPDGFRERLDELTRSRPLDPRGGTTPLEGAAVLLRAYGQPPRALLAALGAAVGRLQSLGAEVWFAGRADLATAVCADGLHLPERGMAVADARRVFRGRIGRACHDRAGLAAASDADYALLSPIRAVPGKSAPLGFEGAAALVSTCAVPVFLLGGLAGADAGAARASGAHGIAVQRAVSEHPTPGGALAEILREFGRLLAE